MQEIAKHMQERASVNSSIVAAACSCRNPSLSELIRNNRKPFTIQRLLEDVIHGFHVIFEGGTRVTGGSVSVARMSPTACTPL